MRPSNGFVLSETTAGRHPSRLSRKRPTARFCAGSIQYPAPGARPGDFIDALADIVRRRDIDVLLPMTDLTTELVLRHRERFPGARIPFPDYSVYESVTDKARLFETARGLGVPIPETQYFDKGADALEQTDRFHYPVVLKPFRSRITTADGVISTSVTYAHSGAELEERIRGRRWLHDYPLMVQQYIRGRGQGVFVLCRDGHVVASFAHRRIREKPPTGGVSVLSESIEMPPRMLAIAEQLLGPLGWNGVAMIEFKVAGDGTPYLMEINGRFWGSLQLAVDAGVDFPFLLYQLAVDTPLQPVTSYATGVRCRWLLGDLDHVYAKLKAGRAYSTADKLKSAGRFLLPFGRGLRYETNRLSDMGPFWFELRQYLKLDR
jgi:predicted ATP-grasp superfamily ATP-dependent carboligase